MTNHNVKETKVVKDVDEWTTVRQLHKKGMSIRGIARELKMSKNTVKKLLSPLLGLLIKEKSIRQRWRPIKNRLKFGT